MSARTPDAAIDRVLVQERYETAMLAVAGVRSDGDFDLLPYYEGQRDALRRLLEPTGDEADPRV